MEYFQADTAAFTASCPAEVRTTDAYFHSASATPADKITASQ